jgi:hypothetical protein
MVQGQQIVLKTFPHSSPKQPKQNGLEVWLKLESICLASVKPRVQTPVPPQKKKKDKKWQEFGVVSHSYSPYTQEAEAGR